METTDKTRIQLRLTSWLMSTGVLMAATLFAAWNPATISAAPNTTEETFSYVIENRPDPFQPFITEKSASTGVDMNEIVDGSEPLTGMQLFEPGQLTLVALMHTNGENVAMVQDFTGKGYVLTEGTKIGRHGVIKEIGSNSVIIEETAWTRAGKKIVTKAVMTLKKDEGEE